jgi:hypothetical protein
MILYGQPIIGLGVPSAVAFTASPGVDDGDIVIDIDTLPVSWGDLTVPGDDAGIAGTLEWWNDYDGWITLTATPATGLYTVNVIPSLWGDTIDIRVRGISDSDQVGVSATDSVIVPGTDTAFELYTDDLGVPYTTDFGQPYYRI